MLCDAELLNTDNSEHWVDEHWTQLNIGGKKKILQGIKDFKARKEILLLWTWDWYFSCNGLKGRGSLEF